MSQRLISIASSTNFRQGASEDGKGVYKQVHARSRVSLHRCIKLSGWRNITQSLRLKAPCLLCNQYHQEFRAVCPDCLKYFKTIDFGCQICATPLPDNSFLLCGQCIQLKPAFDRTFTSFQFVEPLRSLLHQYKYHGQLYLRSLFVHLIALSIPHEALKTQCLIPIPLHTNRLKQRGFNQAYEIAKKLSKQFKIPFEPDICQKIVQTELQANLKGDERRNNVKNAFKVKPSPYSHITLVDDLVTTGSTVNEIARCFKKQGVKQIDIWCCAKTV